MQVELEKVQEIIRDFGAKFYSRILAERVIQHLNDNIIRQEIIVVANFNKPKKLTKAQKK